MNNLNNFAHFPQPELITEPSSTVGPTPTPPPPPSSSTQMVFPAAPLPPSLPSGPSESFMYKNRLQEFTQRSAMQLPVYHTYNEGSMHAPKFRSTVVVDGVTYTSESTFFTRKAAEQDVAKHALECISIKFPRKAPEQDEGRLIQDLQEDTVFCKSILNEFAAKMKMEVPTYTTIQSNSKLLPLFASTLVFNGVTYRGEPRRSKKEAEQLAARVVIQSLLADDRYGAIVSKIIQSKAKLYNALNVKDSNVFNFDNTPAGVNKLNDSSRGVDSTAVTVCVPTSESLNPISGAELPRHEFKPPKSGQGPNCIDLPIAFVPAVVGQASNVGESSRKRRKKNKRAKLNADTQLAVPGGGIPFNQTTPCSLAL